MPYDASRAAKRDERARKMRAFYEPAYFGQPASSYDRPTHYANNSPTTMGGFQHMRYEPDAGMGSWLNLPEGSIGDIALDAIGPDTSLPGPDPAGLAEDYELRQLYENPLPLGKANLSGYGVGQLSNYGVGSLKNYGFSQAYNRLRGGSR